MEEKASNNDGSLEDIEQGIQRKTISFIVAEKPADISNQLIPSFTSFFNDAINHQVASGGSFASLGAIFGGNQSGNHNQGHVQGQDAENLAVEQSHQSVASLESGQSVLDL
jgi:hypothetical protein